MNMVTDKGVMHSFEGAQEVGWGVVVNISVG